MTSDSDFTPLAMKLLAKGKQVIGFGRRTAPEPFRNACSVFLYTDTFSEPTQEGQAQGQASSSRRTTNELRGDTELMNALRAAVDNEAGNEGWALINNVRQHVVDSAKLSSSSYGYKSWRDLIRATEYFEEKPSEGNQFYFRRKPWAKTG
jgi:hypothetical protein